jgi:UDP:flavonoid glycosyltransferase YjiC (YdhE family)
MAAALELQRRHHDVLFAGSLHARWLADEARIRFAPIHDLEPIPEATYTRGATEIREHWRGRREDPDYIRSAWADELDLIRAFRPDLLVFDFRHEAGVLAASLGIRAISINDVDGLSQCAWLQDRQLAVLREIAGEGSTKPYGDAIALAEFAFFQPIAANPAGVARALSFGVDEIRFVGPLVLGAPPDLGSRDDLRRSFGASTRPLVTVAFGGSNFVFADLRATLRALRPVDADFIVVPGPSIRPELLTEETAALSTGGRSVIVPSPGLGALPYLLAADLLVCAGAGTLMESIVCGTPALVVPTPFVVTHVLHARRMAELGLAHALPAPVRPAGSTYGDDRELERRRWEQLAQALPGFVASALADIQMRTRVQALAAQLNQQSGARNLAEWIESKIWL